MFLQAYIHTALEILASYGGKEPFNNFLKKYFAAHKKFGSRDRKQITHLCYCFFRLGRSLNDIDAKEKLALGLFLVNNEKHSLLEFLNADFNEMVEDALPKKLDWVKKHYVFKEEDIFSLEPFLSKEIEISALSRSILKQPFTFLRIRPGKEKTVTRKLENAGIGFELNNGTSIQLAPAVKVEVFLSLNEEVVVQDLNSQKVLQAVFDFAKNKNIANAWDCCAASGGKSILLKDHFPGVQLTVSDVRESILINLKKRFDQAGIRGYKSFVADISSSSFRPKNSFDLIICDVPCSGSGTWGRTPEQLYFFDEKKITYYAELQKKIVANASKALKSGGLLAYITCSVFKQENEEAVEFIEKNLGLTLISQQYFKGYHQQADTLFTSLFTTL